MTLATNSPNSNDLTHSIAERPIVDEERFMKLFLASEHRLRGFILTMVPRLSDAEDILQDALMVMWRKFDDFEPDTDFVAWGISVARFQVFNYRRRERARRVLYCDELIARLEEATQTHALTRDARIDALESCMSRLPEKDRELIRLRYFDFAKVTVKEVSSQLDRRVDAVYKALNRIHDRLLFCIRHTT